MRPRWGRFDLFFRFVTPVGLCWFVFQVCDPGGVVMICFSD
jgi:hypothetical protein